jgi:hypothetical protein
VVKVIRIKGFHGVLERVAMSLAVKSKFHLGKFRVKLFA